MDAGADRIAIGALSQRTGTNVETIRYYERVSLLPAPARSPGGYRLYGMQHLKRLIFIRRARALGFSLDEVRTLLRLGDERRRPCAEVRVVAEAHLDDVQAKLADLRAMERVLKATVAKCGEGRSVHCPLIETLYRDAATDTPGALSSQPDDRRGRPALRKTQRRRQSVLGLRARPTTAKAGAGAAR